MHRLFHYNLDDPDQSNAWYLVVEIFWASMLAAAITFNSAFALRLGATNAQVGWLTSLPALVAVVVSIPAGRFLQKRASRKPWILAALTIYRVGFILVAFLPLIHLAGINTGSLVIVVLVAITIPVHFFNVGFIPMLSEVVPEKQRAGVFSARNIVYNLALSIFVFVFGIWLEKVAFPKNYTIMYLFGFGCTLLSLTYLLKVVVPDSIPTQAATVKGKSDRGQDFRYQLKRNIPFIRITIDTILHGMGMWAVLPLYVLYYVRDLGAEEAWLGLNSTVSSISMIIGFALWRWLVVRWGDYPSLKRTIVLIGFYPVAVALLGSLPLILIATAVNGLITPGVTLSHFNTLLKVTPEEDRPGYTAIYMTIANLGIFVGPLLGVALGDSVGFEKALIICGAISIIGSTSFWWWPVSKETKQVQNIVV